jgi:hypothetical protein
MKIGDRYFWRDIETMELYEVSKETHEAMMKMWEATKPKGIIGKVFIVGTGGEIPKDNIKDIWMDKQ